MFMRKLKAPAVFVLLLISVSEARAEHPSLGQPINESEIESLVVWPDGRGLPKGQGTSAKGELLYQQHCMSCHGVEGQGGINDTLVGGQVELSELPKIRTVGSYWPYATSLFDYIRRSMPYNTPGSLNNDELYSVTAYLLSLNEVIATDTVLNAPRLRSIELKNRSRFYSDYPLP